MFHSRTARVLGLATVVTLGVVAGSAGTQNAVADGAPSATDVVGVGSDIVQNSADFLADGDISGHAGYNAAGNRNRLISIDATTDGNGRSAFTDPSLGAGGVPLNPTVVLRAGTSPVQRPNGGNAGLNALTNDGANGTSANRISFARTPNLPTEAQQNAAKQNLGSPLHSVQIADDQQVIATATTTNAPAVLTGSDLVAIYKGDVTKWNQLPGNSGGSSDTIVPLIPQSSAGVRNIFLNALKPFNNGTAVTPSAATNVQQNDPSTITDLPAGQRANAIVPFPVGRYNLLNSNYFRNPATPYNAASPAAPITAAGITLLRGTNSFSADLPYYIVFRESDYASTTAWQPGGTLNWVKELFLNPNPDKDPSIPAPCVDSAPGRALLTSAGVTPKFVDRGADTSG